MFGFLAEPSVSRGEAQVAALPDEDGASAKTFSGDQPPPTPVRPEHEVPDAQAVASEGKRRGNVSKDELDRSMIIWTRAAAVFTAFLALLACLQAWIIWGQLGEIKTAREGGDKPFADQISVMQDQVKAIQGQVNQIMAKQRPWLAVSDLKSNDIAVYPVGPGILIDASYKITNFGYFPAVEVFISTALIFSDRESFDDQSARNLCNEHPRIDDKLLAGYSNLILPGQVLELIGYPLRPNFATIFSHGVENLVNAGVRSVAADFFLAGCITYRTLGSEILHHTGFAYKAQIIDARMPDYTFARLPLDKGPVRGNLVVIPTPYGNFAD